MAKTASHCMLGLKHAGEGEAAVCGLLAGLGAPAIVVGYDLTIHYANPAFTRRFPEAKAMSRIEEIESVIGLVVTGGGCCHGLSLDQKPVHSLKDAVIAVISGRATEASVCVEKTQRVEGHRATRHFLCNVSAQATHAAPLATILLTDVTHIYDQKAQLEQQNVMKNQFLGMVAHDLRNPISLVRGFATLLRDNCKARLPDNERQMLDVIYEQSDFALFLVDDLLDLSQIESGKMRLEMELVDYAQLVQEAIRRNGPLLARKGMTAFFSCRGALPPLEIDRRKIEQVLNNLISNAVKYSPSNTVVDISVEHPEPAWLSTRVVDHGQGIHEADMERLFNCFECGRCKPTGGEKSTGLGLVIAKRIIEAHGGTIGVRSRIGEGAEFFFRLPVQPEEATAGNI